MVKKQKQKTNLGKNIFQAVLAVIFIAVLVCGSFFFTNKIFKKDKVSADRAQEDGRNTNTATIDTQKKTEDDKEEDGDSYGNAAKEQALNTKQPEVETDSNTGKKIATPIVTYIGEYEGNIEANGTITNIVSRIGTCTYIFTKGDESFSQTAEVLASPRETQCAGVSIEKGKFTPGEWSVKIKYESELSEGVSDATTFVVN